MWFGVCNPAACKDGRSDINVADYLCHHRPAFVEFRALHHHRHANRWFVRNTFIDQTVFAKHESIVTHVDDERLVMNSHFFKLLKDAPDTIVNCKQRFTISTIEIVKSAIAMVCKINPVPTVALVAHPSRCVVLSRDVIRRRQVQFHILIAARVPLGGCKIGVHCLVRQGQEKRLIALLLFEPIQRRDRSAHP